jgi:hypothetical protein
MTATDRCRQDTHSGCGQWRLAVRPSICLSLCPNVSYRLNVLGVLLVAVCPPDVAVVGCRRCIPRRIQSRYRSSRRCSMQSLGHWMHTCVGCCCCSCTVSSALDGQVSSATSAHCNSRRDGHCLNAIASRNNINEHIY